MTRFRLSIFVLTVIVGVSLAFAHGARKPRKMAQAKHIAVSPDEIKWGPAPPGLPPGAQMAVLRGDPSKAGAPFTIRARFPDGYRVPPHWHPTDENVTVIQGTLHVGMGTRFDETAGKELIAGSYALMPKGMRHFAWSSGETTIQIYGTGPFAITYVNPADDPRRKTK